LIAIRQIALGKSRARIYGATMAFAEIIEDCHFMAFVEKQFRANAANITSAANNENFHPAKFRRSCAACQKKAKRLRLFLLLRFFRVRAGYQLFLLLRFLLLQAGHHLPDTTMFSARG
jgi:hypothetical protein